MNYDFTDAAWAVWGSWSACSHTCTTQAAPKRIRYRTCTNPSPNYGGRICSDPSPFTQSTSITTCEPQQGACGLCKQHARYFAVKKYHYI
jgi:hypothetical protein